METKQVINTRRSSHNFDSTKLLSDTQLHELFDLVKLAPSGYNLQPWEFLVLRDKKNKERLAKCAYNQQHIIDASATVVVLGNLDPYAHGERVFDDWQEKGYMTKEITEKTKESVKQWSSWDLASRRIWTTRSTALAAMTLMIAAKDMELTNCPMEGFNADAIRKEFSIPQRYEVVMLIAIGYESKLDGVRRMRRSFEEIVHLERF